MDGLFVRGGAVALLTIGSALPAAAQSPGTSRGDTIVRVIDATVRARLDSIKTLWRRFDDEPVTSELSVRLREQLEAMATAMRAADGARAPRIFIRRDDGSPFEMQTGWIGITTGDVPLQEHIGPGVHLVHYFAHPAIVSVERNSPAQAAGILAGDSLIAYDGMDVVGRTLNLTKMLIPDRKLGVTVRRDGENHEYAVIVAKPPHRMFIREWADDDPFHGDGEARVFRIPPSAGGRPFGPMIMGGRWVEGGMPHVFTLSANGVFGASMMTLDPVLAKSLNLQPGVLVKGVSNATAADRAGLRPGDVIVAVGDQSVKTLADLQAATMSRADARTVTFQVMRDKKPRIITVTWSSPASP